MRRGQLAALLGAILLLAGLLQGCGGNGDTKPLAVTAKMAETGVMPGGPAEPETDAAGRNGESAATLAAQTAELGEPGNDDASIAAAALWVRRAFGVDVQEAEGVTAEVWYAWDGLKNVRFSKDGDLRWNVHLADGSRYPKCVYHYHHLYDGNFDIAADDSFVFDEDSIGPAYEFLKSLYPIDGEPETVRAYVYKNRVAVQFGYADGDCFDVRMHYENYEPVGCFYIEAGEDADAWIDYNSAKIVYEWAAV